MPQFCRAGALPGTALVLLTALSPPALAQRFLSRTYSESDGLSSTAVSGIGQDARGRILFLTRSAISRFDGAKWDGLDLGLRIADSDHLGLVLAPDGSVWTVDGGAQLRLFTLDHGDRWQMVPPAPVGGVEAVTPTAVTVLPGRVPPVIVIGTSSGQLAAWNGTRWTVGSAVAGTAGAPVSGLVGRSDGSVAAVVGDELCIADVTAGIGRVWRPEGTPEGRILAVAADPDDVDRLWLLGVGWLGRTVGEHTEVLCSNVPILDASRPASIQPDGLGAAVITDGSTAWLVDLDGCRAMSLDTTSGLGSVGVSAVFLDHQRNLWFGGGRGVTRIGDRRLVSYTREHGLLDDEVTAILETSPGELVLGHPSGLTVLTDAGVRRTTPLPSGPSVRVMDLAADAEGSIWIADGRGGLLRLRPDGRPEPVALEAPALEVTAVVVDPDLGVVAGTDRGLMTIAQRGAARVHPPLPQVAVRRMVAGSAARLAVATVDQGVLLRENDRWQTVANAEDIDANQVYTVAGTDPTWVGTRAGLYQVERGELRRPRDPRLDLRRPVFMLLIDRQDRLWIGTDHGLYRFDGERLVRFTTAMGLAGNELNRAAAHEDRKGRLWFGTDRGLSCYRPKLDVFRPEPPRIDRIELDTGSGFAALDHPVALPPTTSALSFAVHALSWVDERAIEVRGRLDGFDTPWQKIAATGEGPAARYFNLPPGQYRLEVQARNPTRDWGEVVHSPWITIQAPLWRRTWFQSLASLSGLAVVTAAAVMAQRRRRSALTDAVSGELNREGLKLRLTRRLRRPGRGPSGLLTVRIDRFEAVIASLGHAQGDALLAEAALRLRSRLPGCDIGRLEGATFGVLLDRGFGRDGDSPIREVQQLLARPYRVDGHQVVSSVTCGIVANLEPGTDPEHLLRDAVAALRHAADEGSGSRQIFRPEMREQALRDLDLEADLRRAIEADELRLEYQPILDEPGGEVVALEALLRWRHPRLGDLLPEQFLGMAEATGLMVPLGAWALEHAVATHAELGRRNPVLSDAVLHVNLHAHQLGQGDIVAAACSALEVSGLRPGLLALELTEQALMRDPGKALLTLAELDRVGIGLCLDDFGTGHSSLALLRRFPVDTLKIDRSFVSDLASTEGIAVVAAIIELARALRLEVIAEGVEQHDQLRTLHGLGCQRIQGFLLARPMSPTALLEWLGARAAAV